MRAQTNCSTCRRPPETTVARTRAPAAWPSTPREKGARSSVTLPSRGPGAQEQPELFFRD